MRTLAANKLARGDALDARAGRPFTEDLLACSQPAPHTPTPHRPRTVAAAPASQPASFCNHGARQWRMHHHRRPKGGGLHPGGLPVLRCVHLCFSASTFLEMFSPLLGSQSQSSPSHSLALTCSYAPFFVRDCPRCQQFRARPPSITPKASSFGANRLWNPAPIFMASLRCQRPPPAVLVRLAEAERYGSDGTVTLDPT